MKRRGGVCLNRWVMELNPPPNNFRFHGVNYDERPLDDLIVFFAFFCIVLGVVWRN